MMKNLQCFFLLFFAFNWCQASIIPTTADIDFAAAVAQAASGDTILITQPTKADDVVINKNLTIGSPVRSTINSSSIGIKPIIIDGAGIKVNFYNIYFQGAYSSYGVSPNSGVVVKQADTVNFYYCKFEGCSAASGLAGGAVNIQGGAVNFYDTHFYMNKGYAYTEKKCYSGGAIYAENGQVGIFRCKLEGNNTQVDQSLLPTGNEGAGGAVYIGQNASIILVNSILTYNTTRYVSYSYAGGAFDRTKGAALFIADGALPSKIINCSFSANYYGTSNGSNSSGYALETEADVDIINSLFYGSGYSYQVVCHKGTMSFDHSMGKAAPAGSGQFSATNGVAGSIYLDNTNSCTLKDKSPAVDAGTPDVLGIVGNLDQSMYLRVADGNGDGTATIDIGAREYGNEKPSYGYLDYSHNGVAGDTAALGRFDEGFDATATFVATNNTDMPVLLTRFNSDYGVLMAYSGAVEVAQEPFSGIIYPGMSVPFCVRFLDYKELNPGISTNTIDLVHYYPWNGSSTKEYSRLYASIFKNPNGPYLKHAGYGAYFNQLDILEESSIQEFTLTNIGNQTLELLSDMKVTGADEAVFSVYKQPAKKTLAPGESTTYQLRFAPTDERTFDGSYLEVETNAAISTSRIFIWGKAYRPYRMYVTTTGKSNNTGNSWSSPVDLQTGINRIIQNGDGEVWAATGSYEITSTGTMNGGYMPENKTILLNGKVKVYGGFSKGAIKLSERDPSSTSTISGRNYIGGTTYRAQHVVTVTSSQAYLNGFMIIGGSIDKDGWGNNGSQLKMTNGTVENCLILDDGIAGSSATEVVLSGAATMANCSIGDKVSIDVFGSAVVDRLTPKGHAEIELWDNGKLTNSTISDPYIRMYGNASLANDSVFGKVSYKSFDGARTAEGNRAKVTNCYISGTLESDNAYAKGGTLVARNCIVNYLSADWDVEVYNSLIPTIGATGVNRLSLYSVTSSSLAVKAKSLIMYNTVVSQRTSIDNINGTASVQAYYSAIKKGTGTLPTGNFLGTGSFLLDSVEVLTDDYRPVAGGLLVNAGDNDNHDYETDLAGNPRAFNRMDIGAYELQDGRAYLQFEVSKATARLSNVTININGETLAADAGGTAAIYLEPGTYSYTISREGYRNFTDSIVLKGAQKLAIDLSSSFIVMHSFSLVLSSNGQAIEGATLTINGTHYTTDAQGGVALTLEEGSYDYTVSMDGFRELSGTFNANGAVSIPVDMTDNQIHYYQLSLNCICNGAALQGVRLQIGDTVCTSDAQGVININLKEGEYAYSVSKDAYVGQADTINLVANKTLDLTLAQAAYKLTVTVHDANGNAIAGAAVSLGDQQATADANGELSFSVNQGDFSWTATADGFASNQGQTSVTADKALTISLQNTVSAPNFELQAVELSPNPCSGTLYLKTSSIYTRVVVCTSNGVALLQQSVGAGSNPINVSALPAGLYVLKAYGPSASYTSLFVVE